MVLKLQFSGSAHARATYRVSPVGVIGLLPQATLEVEVLGIVGGLRAWVADVALRVKSLSRLHGVLWAHACERRGLNTLARMCMWSHGPGAQVPTLFVPFGGARVALSTWMPYARQPCQRLTPEPGRGWSATGQPFMAQAGGLDAVSSLLHTLAPWLWG